MKSLIILLALFLSATHAFAQEPVWSKKYHTGSVTCLDFSGDGGKLLSGGMDSTVKFLDVFKSEVLKSYKQKRAISSVQLNSSEMWFIASDQGYGRPHFSNKFYLNSDTADLLIFTGTNFSSPDISSGASRYILNTSSNKTILLKDDVRLINICMGEISGFNSSGGGFLGNSSIIEIINLDSLTQHKRTRIKEGAADNTAFSVSLDEKYVVYGGHDVQKFHESHGYVSYDRISDNWLCEIYDLVNKKTFVIPDLNVYYQSEKLNDYNSKATPHNMVLQTTFTPDSKKLLTANKAGSIHVRSVPDGIVIDSLGFQTSLVTALAVDMEGRYYISAHADSTLRLWTPGIPNIFKRILLKSPVTTIAVSPDSVHFATAHTDGTVALWNIDSLAAGAPTDTIFTDISEEAPFKNIPLTAEPNPFKNSTTIRFSLPTSLKIKLVMTDILGREVAVLKDEVVEIGEQNVVFKNENLPNGTYFITLSGDGLLKTIPVNIAR